MLFRNIALSQLDGDEDAAEESVHQMIDIALCKKNVIVNHPKPAAYLTKILKNCIKKQIDKRKHSPVFIDISTLAEILPAPNDDYADEPVIPDSEIEEMKAHLLSQLTEDEKTLYTMYCADKMPSREISEKLGISDAAVRTRIKLLKIKIRLLAAEIFS